MMLMQWSPVNQKNKSTMQGPVNETKTNGVIWSGSTSKASNIKQNISLKNKIKGITVARMIFHFKRILISYLMFVFSAEV